MTSGLEIRSQIGFFGEGAYTRPESRYVRSTVQWNRYRHLFEASRQKAGLSITSQAYECAASGKQQELIYNRLAFMTVDTLDRKIKPPPSLGVAPAHRFNLVKRPCK